MKYEKMSTLEMILTLVFFGVLYGILAFNVFDTLVIEKRILLSVLVGMILGFININRGSIQKIEAYLEIKEQRDDNSKRI